MGCYRLNMPGIKSECSSILPCPSQKYPVDIPWPFDLGFTIKLRLVWNLIQTVTGQVCIWPSKKCFDSYQSQVKGIFINLFQVLVSPLFIKTTKEIICGFIAGEKIVLSIRYSAISILNCICRARKGDLTIHVNYQYTPLENLLNTFFYKVKCPYVWHQGAGGGWWMCLSFFPEILLLHFHSWFFL